MPKRKRIEAVRAWARESMRGIVDLRLGSIGAAYGFPGDRIISVRILREYDWRAIQKELREARRKRAKK